MIIRTTNQELIKLLENKKFDNTETYSDSVELLAQTETEYRISELFANPTIDDEELIELVRNKLYNYMQNSICIDYDEIDDIVDKTVKKHRFITVATISLVKDNYKKYIYTFFANDLIKAKENIKICLDKFLENRIDISDDLCCHITIEKDDKWVDTEEFFFSIENGKFNFKI